MNERIEKLIRKSNILFPGTDVVDCKIANIEKFAELIVRECSYRCYLTGEYQMAHELSDLYGFKFDFKKMMEEDDE